MGKQQREGGRQANKQTSKQVTTAPSSFREEQDQLLERRPAIAPNNNSPDKISSDESFWFRFATTETDLSSTKTTTPRTIATNEPTNKG